jgi:leucyl-tRNA synthetase
LLLLLLLLLLQGAEVHFKVAPAEGSGLGPDTQLSVYTTRPDTLFGATYMVVAPEHPLLSQVGFVLPACCCCCLLSVACLLF